MIRGTFVLLFDCIQAAMIGAWLFRTEVDGGVEHVRLRRGAVRPGKRAVDQPKMVGQKEFSGLNANSGRNLSERITMTMRRKITCAFVVVTVLLAASTNGTSQTADKSRDEEKGITFYETFQGSSNTLGQVLKLDTTVGYDFSKHFGVDAGIPVYFVHASSTSTATGASSHNGIGDAYIDLRLTVNNPVVNFASVLRGRAPTGDTSSGLSTGRATFDWTNHFDKTILKATPFINAGVANTVSDTHLFDRPFTSLGIVGHFEGGATLKVVPMVKIGASAYAILPSGQQEVFSKLVQRVTSPTGTNTTGTTARGASAGSGHGRGGIFGTTTETSGTDVTRDDGYSAWIAGNAGPMDLELGFTRSVPYNLNTISFAVGFNLETLIRKAKGR